ncbi:MAG: tetratricopeptide repeat protein [Saprospiraceae bacterium]|nr:tetratricopeptide repeat protein [Pyrinomonadaceae bacterium]
MRSSPVLSFIARSGIRRLLFCVAALLLFVPHAPAQAAKPAFRSVTVVTEPNAIVWIDGVKYGTTAENGRLLIATVATGKRMVRVRADGFKEVSRPLLASQKGDFEIPLTKTNDEAELAYQQAEVLAGSDREKAAEAYKKAIRLRPRFAEAHIALARLYSAGRDAENAEKAIKEARKIVPRSAEVSVIEGRVFRDGGDDDKAIASFKRAITEGGGFQPEAYTGLGLMYKEKAESAGASADYDGEKANYIQAAKNFTVAVKQLSGAPDAVSLYQFLGLVYEQQKKFAEAIAVYREFLRFFPDNPESAAFESFIVQLKKQLNEPK